MQSCFYISALLSFAIAQKYYASTLISFDYKHPSMGLTIRQNQGGIFYSSAIDNSIAKINATGVFIVAGGNSTQTVYVNGSIVNLDVPNNPFAPFKNPCGVAFSSVVGGRLHVADRDNDVIRRIELDGTIIVVAGIFGIANYADGNTSIAMFNSPTGIAGKAGDLYVADTGNNRIRKISASGDVSTFAGSSQGYNDGIRGTFRSPKGLAVDNQGNIYVADTDNHSIRVIYSNRTVQTIAGTGFAGFADGQFAQFNSPTDVALDADGNIFVADSLNNKIRKINITGFVSTIGGAGL